jgi:hypothetical protein
MAADSTNRATVRAELKTMLQTAIGTATVQAYYDYQIGDFEGLSPVVVVTSGPSLHERESYKSGYVTDTFELDVHVFVLYTQGTAWTEEDAEDRLDLIEKEIADCVIDNTSGTVWNYLDWGGASVIDSVVLGGEEYKHEVVTLQARI